MGKASSVQSGRYPPQLDLLRQVQISTSTRGL